MKQVSQNYKSGAIRLEKVNAPALKPGGVLVQSLYTVISAGTEGMKVKEGKMSYLEKAKARPDQVKKVIQSVQQNGLVATYEKVMNKLDSLTPLGYSLSGIVIAVGSGAEEFVVGQRVACAGAGYANHAQVNFVPKNLVVPVEDHVSMEHAAFATIGAIAMQGFRQAELQLGETACVIGLGLIGQLLVQILRAAGVNVIGVDLSEERCQLAVKMGAAAASTPDDPKLASHIERLTFGKGADCIFLAAGGNSNGPVELAVEIARDRAKVVDIGKTKLDLPWKDYYEKELDVRFSRSYGPGRYDPNYEERGIDYPIGYVRWTEGRNMASFLDLVAKGQINLEPIISAVHPFSEAERVYQDMAEGRGGGLGILFQYPEQVEPVQHLPTLQVTQKLTEVIEDKVKLGVIGAGNYASSMLLPHLVKHNHVRLLEVATSKSLSAANAVRKFAFERSSTDYQALLKSSDIDAVIIATRHGSHAKMTAEALQAGKAVFVEKPLAIDLAGAELVRQAVIDSGNERLLVGFNRRYSPLVKQVAKVFDGDGIPLMMNYRVHAGQMEAGSWYLDTSEGSRFVGEAGHFLDVFSFITRSRPVSVVARALRPMQVTQDDLENISVTITYENGSVGNLMYLTQGGKKVPKEFLEVFGGGCTVQLHNFESLTVFQGNMQRKVKARGINKGQKEEIHAFVSAVKSGLEMPISIDSLLDTTLATLATVESLRTGQAVQLADYWIRETVE
ncbi:MAG: Gfo/Idh/MocA family oxidoreductase [Moorea sp. SIO1G6]|uniref:Bi-domain-containing oxidoreductase n=1 Tax=Moorena producens (strain JHB) TaxID=1454205 RepID=A0A1D9GAE0_MOOP1|nr:MULTISPECIES: bi-domain-containing oxidoreductase [Moorena]AOY84350.1 bi-domain-containing oxidoreductase [Moorena producens JHB]NET63567.1 Gfo/Idh/MocA family oxidoreductase [Moorena sp. SIO1G6]